MEQFLTTPNVENVVKGLALFTGVARMGRWIYCSAPFIFLIFLFVTCLFLFTLFIVVCKLGNNVNRMLLHEFWADLSEIRVFPVGVPRPRALLVVS